MRSFQHGMSLLSVLIGMNIAMVSVLVSLQLYTTHWASTIDMKESTRYSNQLTGTFVALEKTLMATGFGLSPTGSQDIVAQNIAATSTASSSTSMYWRYRDSDVVCIGVEETSQQIDGRDYRVLTMLEPSATCDESTELSSMSWDVETGILGNWLVDQEMNTYLASNSTLFNFQIETTDCSPYRAMTVNSHYRVTVKAPTLSELNGQTTTPSNALIVCLANTTP